MSACLARGVPLVLGTTGIDADAARDVDESARERGVAIFHAPNFAIGAVLVMRFADQAARVLPRVEIIELHYEHKLDRPSGTAAVTAERITRETGAEVPIHSVRLPGLVAHQEMLLGGEGELLTIRHDALSREAFVPGALLAIRRVRDLPAGPDRRARAAARIVSGADYNLRVSAQPAPAPFGRIVTAMVTPFDEDGSLDLGASRALARYLVGQRLRRPRPRRARPARRRRSPTPRSSPCSRRWSTRSATTRTSSPARARTTPRTRCT